MAGCGNSKDHKDRSPRVPDSIDSKGTAPEAPIHSVDQRVRFYKVNDDQYVQLDSVRLMIPPGTGIDKDNIYDAIYQVKADTLIRTSFLITAHKIFLTTYDDVGTGVRAMLYIFDLANKSLLRHVFRDLDYLSSSVAIFIIDSATDKVFAVYKPSLDDSIGKWILPASLSYVRGNSIHDIKLVYKLGDETPNGRSLISFYKQALKKLDVRPRRYKHTFTAYIPTAGAR